MFCSGRGVLEEESKKWVGWVRGLEEGKGLVWRGGRTDDFLTARAAALKECFIDVVFVDDGTGGHAPYGVAGSNAEAFRERGE